MNRIKKEDMVMVTTGKSKGHVGAVLKVKDNYAVVSGANLVTKHIKGNPNTNTPGEIRKQEALIHISNLALYNQETQKKDKVGFKFITEGEQQVKVRYFKSNQAEVDQRSKETK